MQCIVVFLPAGPTTGDRWLIDDVSVVQQCLDPTTLNVTNLASVSATLNWTNVGSATQWEVEVLPVASTPTGVGVVTGATTYSATGLTPGTDYIFYVRSLCAGGVKSAWVSLFFSTKPLGSICVSPIVINRTNVKNIISSRCKSCCGICCSASNNPNSCWC